MIEKSTLAVVSANGSTRYPASERSAVEQKWRRTSARDGRIRDTTALLVRFAIAAALVVSAFLIWLVFSRTFGVLDAYVTFYPAVVLSAILLGFEGGLFATALSGLLAIYWIHPPIRELWIDDPADLASCALFCSMGFFLSAFSRRYQSARERAVKLEKELAVMETTERLRFALQAAQAGVWEYDVSTGSATWSEEMWQLFGNEHARNR
jgi:K+-sensing histidine kinase KdpD